MVKNSRNLFASMNCVFRSNHCDQRFPFKTICMNVTSSERGDFKLCIGSLNNKFPYMVEGLLNILHAISTTWRQTVIKSAKQRVICYEPKLEKVKLNSNNIFETSYEFDLRV